MPASDFEQRLIEAIQPIRYHALAQALYVLFDSGIYETLRGEPGSGAEWIAKRHDMDPARLQALCHYLANEGYLSSDDGWRLTAKAQALEPFMPWYTLLIGGYAGTFGQLGATLRAGAPWASRDGAKVGAGSCGMSRLDVLPMVDRLLDRLPGGELTIVDLGCGDGAFLADLLRHRPRLRGIGMEPDPISSGLALERVVQEGLSDRMTVHRGRAADVSLLDLPDGQLCFLTAFVLQEMLEQDGEPAVAALLRDTMGAFPRAHWLVVEVDYRLDDPRTMAHGLGKAYYNPYFLLHALTEQRLERREFWDRLFAEAGLEIAALDHPDEAVDSTGLELGYLLRCRAD
ncbi:hypothetical protein [Nocardia sp. NPDC052566]|uniref:hypothetical protein n=1 Tax=Nocardia sp. NPDC052566 TaxID=3364330 RepID=UPI0037CB1B90